MPGEVVTAPKAVVVPHAGYIYSGAVAASAYAELTQRRDTIRRVLILCPTHRVYVRGWRCRRPSPSSPRWARWRSTGRPGSPRACPA
jgi:AmmeMemoRadiSam system protein B